MTVARHLDGAVPVSAAIASEDGRATAPTLGELIDRIAPGTTCRRLAEWPPDVFAFTSTVLGSSGLYRLVVAPPKGVVWPPDGPGRSKLWTEAVAGTGLEWRTWVASRTADSDSSRLPAEVARLADAVDAAHELTLPELEEATRWPTLAAVLELHALADEAARAVGRRHDDIFARKAASLLAATGSFSRLHPKRVRVLPKLRPPQSGITLRSLSHHLALDTSEVDARWYTAPPVDDDARPRSTRVTLLLVPLPTVVHASDFRSVEGPLMNMDAERFGFYEFHSGDPFDPEEILGLVERTRRHVGPIDGLVLPESALLRHEAETLQARLAEESVRFLITGVRRPAHAPLPFGANYAYFGSGDWQAPPQHKHHRWSLDPSQLDQYHLGAALDPARTWWEAIEVHRRALTFVTIDEWLTICPLVCEDLARPDPVTDVLRAVGPTLVVGLLLDGPQLAARWPARYASVLADDPGSSVLTLTSLGMTQRCVPPGTAPSRVIALWKDPRRGLHEIILAEDARAVAVTAHARETCLFTADGRRSGEPVSELVLSGIEQIR